MEGGKSFWCQHFYKVRRHDFFAAAAAVTCNVKRKRMTREFQVKKDMYKTDKTASTRQKIW